VFSKPLLIILANEEIANAASWGVPIIALGILFHGLTLILSNVLFVQMKTKILFGINALAAFLNLVLNLIFLYIFKDILVAVITTFASYFISFLILNHRIKEFIEVHYDFRLIGKCFFASTIMAIFLHVSLGYFRNQFFNFGIIIVLAGVLYFSFLIFLKTFHIKEIEFIKSFLCQKK